MNYPLHPPLSFIREVEGFTVDAAPETQQRAEKARDRELLVGALLSEASEAHDVPSDFIMTITESIRAAIQESDANQSLLAGMENTLDAIQARALGPTSDGHN